MGEGAMNETEFKFTTRWSDFLAQYRESARRTDGEKIQFVFHIFLGAKTRKNKRKKTLDPNGRTPPFRRLTCPETILLQDNKKYEFYKFENIQLQP